MPPQFVFDLSNVDLAATAHDIEAIRRVNPQRGDMEHLTRIVRMFDDGLIAYKDVGASEFWVAGHIPGRPIFPGVLQIEAAAQAASFFTRVGLKWEGFIGFGGVDAVKFRQQVLPGQRLYILVKLIWARHKRVCCNAQGMVDGNLVFEGQITGAVL